MKKLATLIAPALALAAALAGCSTIPATQGRASGSYAASAENGAMRVFTQLDAEAGPAENVFYSPLSVEQAFGLLHAGAAGETRTQLENVFGWPAAEETEARLAAQRRSLLAHGTDADVRLANALWLSDSFRFRPTYLDDTERYYDATARALEFSPGAAEASAQVINDWASEQTVGLIPEVISADALAGDTAAVLTNALLFEAEWETKFDSSEQLPFLFGDGREEQFHLMRETGSFAFVQSGGWQAVRLPYEGERFAMDVITPQRREVMASAPSLAQIAALSEWLDDAEPRLVDLSLPRFEIEYETGLIPPLEALGLTLPFDPVNADLSAMAEAGQAQIFVGDATQLTRLQVYSEGTKAAAVTVLRIVLTGGRAYETEPERVIVDRPFITIIRDLETGEVLFIGRVSEPMPFEPESAEE